MPKRLQQHARELNGAGEFEERDDLDAEQSWLRKGLRLGRD